MSIAKEIRESLLVFADPEKASVLQGFFKTAKGLLSRESGKAGLFYTENGGLNRLCRNPKKILEDAPSPG